jgi:molecular chaperone GrpE
MDEVADAAAAEARARDAADPDLTDNASDVADAGADSPDAALADAGAADPAAALAADLSAQNDKYLRLYAEFENFRRRAVRDRQDAERSGMGSVMKGLLEALDDLARVAHVDPAGTDAKTVVDGVALVEKKLLKSLAGHGLELVDPADEPFDPALHEAITTTPAASADEDHLVAQVYQVGYVLNGTLLRPARVVVKQWNG